MAMPFMGLLAENYKDWCTGPAGAFQYLPLPQQTYQSLCPCQPTDEQGAFDAA